MKTAFTLLLFLSIYSTSCTSQGARHGERSDTSNRHTIEKDTTSNNNPSDGIVTCGDYLADYIADISFDTVVKFRNHSIRIYAYADTERKIALPKALLNNCKNQVIYETHIAVEDLGNVNNKLAIDRNLLKHLIDPTNTYTLRYAMPIGIGDLTCDTINNKIKFHFSLSVPYTDLGNPVNFEIDLRKITLQHGQGTPNKIDWTANIE